MIINGSLYTDTLWTGAESDIWIYLTEDAGFPSESDPGYVVLTDRESGKQLWRSEELSYYTSDSTHRIDIVFDPKDCEDGYLPSRRKVQFQVREDSGEQICSYDCETFPLELWSFDNPSSSFDQEFLEQFYSEGLAESIFEIAESDTMGGNGLCVGMSLLVSLVNGDGIGDIGFSGCDELVQVKLDTPLTGAMEGYTTLDLLKACQAQQYCKSITAQREENFEDLTGLADAVQAYEQGKDAMPVVILEVPEEGSKNGYVHALAAYAVGQDGQGNVRIDVYDPNHPDIIGSYITIYNYGTDDAFWAYHEQTRSGEAIIRVPVGSPKRYGLTYFTSRKYPMEQPQEIWLEIPGYDFSALQNNNLDITLFDPDRFQGLNAVWVSGQGTLTLPGLTGQAKIADSQTSYTIDADGAAAALTLKEEVSSIRVSGEGTLIITCTYEGERGAVTTRFSGTSDRGITVSRDGDTVRFSGGKDGTVTVTYENGETWTKPVEPGEELDITADGENEPTVNDGAFAGGEIAFRDVPSGAYYADAVAWAVGEGITTGTSDTTFSPNAPCTRAQVVTFIWRALGLDELGGRSTENPFRDVPSGVYYRDPVLWAAENDITTGTDAAHFSPDAACTRAQVVTFLWRTDFPAKYVSSGQIFRDVNRTDYYWYPVQWAVEREITTGTSSTTFSPSEICTRVQAVTFLFRCYGT